MNKKYVILIDIDGTLTQEGSKNVSEKVLDSIIKAKQKGHILSIATGRSFRTSQWIMGSEYFNYISCLMGNVIYNNDKKMIEYENTDCLNAEYVRPLIQYFMAQTHGLWTYKNDLEDKTTQLLLPNENRFNAKTVDKTEVEKDIARNKIFQLLATDDMITPEIISKYDKLDFIQMTGNYYDILKKGQSKKNIVDYFKKRYPDYTIVGIGDSNNDYGMLTSCDVSIAMGNSSEDIKSISDFVTKDVDNDGVSYAITDILKI